MLAEVESLVGGVDHDGVFGQAVFVEVVQHLAHAVIDRFHGTEVVFHIALVFPLHDLLVAHGADLFQECLIFGSKVGVPFLLLARIHATIFGHAIAIRTGEFDAFALVFSDFRVVGPVEVAVDFHFVFGKRFAAIRVVIEERGRLGNGDAVE